MKVILCCIITAVSTFGLTQDDLTSSYFKLPKAYYTYEAGALTLRSPSETLTYIEGLGWREPRALAAPLIAGDQVYVTDELLSFLGVDAARLLAVRVGGGGTVRFVLDFGGVPLDTLAFLEQQGRLEEGQILRLDLPPLLLPQELPDPYRGLELNLTPGAYGTELSLGGKQAIYSVFALADPVRLVLDVTPAAFADVTPTTLEVRPGIVYRHFAAPTAIGSSAVHLLEIAPNTGEFRVVGESEKAGTVSSLASGALAAINAGYFDRNTLDAIGLLKVDYGLLSWPSRSRASIGFGLGAPIINRVEARAKVRINGRLFEALAAEESFEIETRAGQAAGLPTQGVITVERGQVISNKVGPRTVPEGGFALVYDPVRRDLALINEGDRAALELDFQPEVFEQVRYAVEAGPLLVSAGQGAFEPSLEAFRRGERILDDYTQQAAIAIKADGTVLLVAADNMIAEELVPLMLSLGAHDAMRLDSGGSTTLFVDGAVVNRNEERRVVSAIVFLPYAN